FRLLFLVFCFCENNGILACGYLPEKTETAPPSFPRRRESRPFGLGFFLRFRVTSKPSFPRRRESRSVGAETYRVKRFLEILRPGFPLSWE
ncbi:TPA: hypothetical protein ACJJFK_002060, partial [Neisseria meningitidis]